MKICIKKKGNIVVWPDKWFDFFPPVLVDDDGDVDDKLRFKVFWDILKTIDSESN